MTPLPGLVLLAALAAGAPEAALPTSPEDVAAARFDAGLACFKRGEYPQALREFEAAYSVAPRFEPLFNIAAANEKLGRPTAALLNYRRYLAEGGAEVPSPRREAALGSIAGLEKQVVTATVQVEGAPADVEVDGMRVGRTPLAPMLLDPGRHQFRAYRMAEATPVQTLELPPGAKLTVVLAPVPLPAPAVASGEAPSPRAAPAPPQVRKKSGMGALRAVGIAADGVGAVLLLGGVIADVLASQDRSHALSLAETANPSERQAFEDDLASFHGKRTAATWLYAGGGAVLVAGIVMSVWPTGSDSLALDLAPTRGGAVVLVGGSLP